MTALDAVVAELALPPALLPRLAGYASLFHKWNQRINLSAARSEHELQLHIVDCLHLVPHLERAVAGWSLRPAPVLDVGSGGGLPAVVVAICLPGVHVTALEPVHKKHAFLRTAARELGLANLTPLAERLEDHGGHNYAAATSRATLDLRDWLVLGLDRVELLGTVFGFEANSRDDLPAGTVRYPYAHEGRRRAIVALQRQAT